MAYSSSFQSKRTSSQAEFFAALVSQQIKPCKLIYNLYLQLELQNTKKNPEFSLQLEHKIHMFIFCVKTILGTSSCFIQNHYILPCTFAWDENT